MDDQQKRIVNAVERYQTFKDLFIKFKKLAEKAVPNEGPLKSLSVTDSKNFTIELNTPFESNIIGKFSMVSNPKGKCFGRITFFQLIEDEENKQFWRVFFDKDGNAWDSWPEQKNKHYLANENHVKDFLFDLLDKYLVLFRLTDKEGQK